MDLAKRIRWAREHRGVTQHELAHRLGVAGGSRVSEWENGRRQPSAPVLMKLPEILEISGHWLLTGQGPRTLDAASAKAEHAPDALETQLIGRVMRGELTLQDAAKRVYAARRDGSPSEPTHESVAEAGSPPQAESPPEAEPKQAQEEGALEAAAETPAQAPEAPGVPVLDEPTLLAGAPQPPVLPSHIRTRRWLQAPIERPDEPRYAPEPPATADADAQKDEADAEEPGSIYEDGYLWGHLH